MDERKKIRQELQELKAPKLEASQGKVPKWEMPEGYLDQLTDRVLEKDAQSNRKYFRMQIVRWAAAAVVILAVGFWWSQTPSAENNPPLAVMDWDQIPTEDLQQYVSDNIDEFDLDLLATTVTDQASSGSGEASSPAEAISTEALEQYLEADDEWLDDLEDEDWF